MLTRHYLANCSKAIFAFMNSALLLSFAYICMKVAKVIINTIAILDLLFVKIPFNWAVRQEIDDSDESIETHSAGCVASLIFLVCYCFCMLFLCLCFMSMLGENEILLLLYSWVDFLVLPSDSSLVDDMQFILRCYLHISIY